MYPERLMRLSRNEQAVLAAVRLNSRMATSQISRTTGLRSHTIQRALRSLRERNIIEPFVMINPHLLGLNDFCLFFNLQQSTAQTRSRVIAALKASPFVAYGAELAGEYQYSASIFSSSVLAVESVLKSLASLHPGGSIKSIFALRLDWSLLASRSNSLKRPELLSRLALTRTAAIDDFDRRFLHLFSRKPDSSFTALAQKLCVTEGAIRARFNRLLESGVIVGVPYHVNWSRIGFFPMRAMISLRGSEPLTTEQLFKLVKREEEVSEIVRCLGGWEVECNFQVASPVATGEIVQRLHGAFNGRIQEIRCANEVAVPVMHRFPDSLLA